MLKLELPFHLTVSPPAASLTRGLTNPGGWKTVEVILEGFSISIETRGRTYQVVSERPPVADRPGISHGAIWPCCFLSLPDGMSIEQQMMLPAAGDAVAISWRLRGRSAASVRLAVNPVFTTVKPLAAAAFEIEPETNGGRLAWRPFRYAAKIIADTNGHFAGVIGRVAGGIIPASFEFDLGPGPAVLLLRAELGSEAGLDSLIGGFFAHLTAERAALDANDMRRSLVAA